MERIKIRLPSYQSLQERGELLKFFMERINTNRNGTKYPQLSLPRMGKVLEGLDLQTIYFMQSTFKDTERRRGLAAACKEFYFSLRPKPELSTPPSQSSS